MKKLYFVSFLFLIVVFKAQVAPVCFNSLLAANTMTVGGTTPYEICVADFNDDGKPDIASGNNGTSNLSYLLGLGTGAFATPLNYPASQAPWTICSADFNNDGTADLAAGDAASGFVTLFLSNYGTISYGGTPQCYGIRSADFNSDGFPDLACSSSTGMSIRLGSATGLMSSPIIYGTGGPGRCLTIADFNTDGNQDIAATNNFGTTVSVLLGTGTGSFSPAVTYTVGAGTTYISSADFNADGNKDLAVCVTTAGYISVLLGSPSGTFAPPVNFAAGPNLVSITTADFNGDSKADIAVGNANPKTITMLQGTGTGSFVLSDVYSLIDAPSFITAVDLNLDGISDIASVSSASNRVTSILGSSSGALTAALTYSANVPSVIKTADLNADGKPDMVVTNNTSSGITVFLSGTSGFSSTAVYSVGASPNSLALSDLNNDGKLDISVSNSASGNVSVLLGQANGAFAAATNFVVNVSNSSLVSVDFNGDGNKDLAVAGTSCVVVLFGNGLGGFAPAVSYSVGLTVASLTSADFNMDGSPDLAVAISIGSVKILLGSPSGTFSAGGSFTTPLFPYGVTAGDFNNDSKSDLAVVNFAFDNVSVLLGQGNGSFVTQTTFPVGAGPYSIYTTDLNADGLLDLVTTNNSAGSISVLLGTGAGNFAASTDLLIGTNPRSVVSADFNQDGRPDLFTASISGNINILLNTVTTISLSSTNTVCLGNSIAIKATGANTYTWSTGSTANPLIISPSSSNTYSVVGKSFGGCAAIASRSITVNSIPLPSLTVNSSTICIGKSFTITPSGADTYTITGGTYVVSPSTTKTYTVTGTNTLTGCRSNPVFQVLTVNPLPTITVAGGAMCAGENFTLSASGASSYTFQSGSAVVSPLTNSTYSVVGMSPAGCVSGVKTASVEVNPLPVILVNSGAICVGKSFTLVPGGANTYTITGGNQVVSPAMTATYGVTGTDNLGCISSAAAVSTVVVTPYPVFTVSGNSSVCKNFPLSLIASGSAMSYNWSNGMSGNLITVSLTSSTNFTITGTTNNCSTTHTRYITVYPLPFVNVNSGVICAGNSFTLTPIGALSYNIPGGSPFVTPVNTTTYAVTGVDANGCIGTAISTVVVNALPVLSVTSDKQIVCAGESAMLVASGAFSYNWGNGSGSATQVVSPSSTSVYNVTGTDVNGCANTSAITVSVQACLSVKNTAGNTSPEVYPNPTAGKVVIDCQDMITLKITNSVGQIIREEMLQPGKHLVDLSAYSNGIYFVFFKQQNQNKTIKIIKE